MFGCLIHWIIVVSFIDDLFAVSCIGFCAVSFIVFFGPKGEVPLGPNDLLVPSADWGFAFSSIGYVAVSFIGIVAVSLI